MIFAKSDLAKFLSILFDSLRYIGYTALVQFVHTLAKFNGRIRVVHTFNFFLLIY